MAEFDVVGVRVEVPSQNPIVLLRDRTSGRYLPIWVGAAEASAIAMAQEGLTPPRPLTHDLLAEVITALGTSLASVHITGLHDGVFYAELRFANGATVSARPSDAIAVALRMGAPITGEADVLIAAGIDIDESEEDDSTVPEDQVERFREFLDQVSPEDFGRGETSA